VPKTRNAEARTGTQPAGDHALRRRRFNLDIVSPPRHRPPPRPFEAMAPLGPARAAGEGRAPGLAMACRPVRWDTSNPITSRAGPIRRARHAAAGGAAAGPGSHPAARPAGDSPHGLEGHGGEPPARPESTAPPLFPSRGRASDQQRGRRRPSSRAAWPEASLRPPGVGSCCRAKGGPKKRGRGDPLWSPCGALVDPLCALAQRKTAFGSRSRVLKSRAAYSKVSGRRW